MSVTIGALRESAPREMRVSLVPEVTDKLLKEGARVLIERTAGERAGFPDTSYKGVDWAAGASERGAGGIHAALCTQRGDTCAQGARRHEFRDGAGAAHLACAVDGRTLLA